MKAFLEAQGYTVKGEVGGCDVMARRGEEPPVIVELKLRFGLDLLLQGVDRLALSESVYLAVPGPAARAWRGERRVRKLLRRLGLGLLYVRDRAVEPILDPLPYRPRRQARRSGRLLGEFARRVGDPNTGGSTRVKLVTAYRQEALRIAFVLSRHGPRAPKVLRDEAEAPRAARILQADVYGWFERVARGIYALTPAGAKGLAGHAGRFAPPRER